MQTSLPAFVGLLIDEGILARDDDRIAFWLLIIISTGLLRVVFNYIGVVAGNNLAWKAIREVRAEFFTKMQSKPLKFHDSVRSGDVMAIATNDMNMLANMINPGIRMVSNAFLTLGFFAVIGLSQNLELTLALIPFFIVYLFTIRWYNRKMQPIAAIFQRKWSGISVAAQDNITGVRVVRAFGGEEFETKKFRDVVEDFKVTWDERQMLQAKYWPLLVVYAAIGFSFFAGVWMVLEGLLTLGALVSFNGMLILLLQPTMIISFAIMMVQSGLAGGERIFRMMHASYAEEEGEKEPKPWPTAGLGKVEFRNVSFTYSGTDKPVLEEVSLIVEPGETVALVGPTGAGKTTLTKLLLRFYDFEGQILVDGVDIQELALRDLRQNIGRVEQDIFLFATTIRENITYGISSGTEVNEEELVQATKMAQAYDFIMEQPDGYDTKVGERGVGLSGGQRQRIAIARCLLTNPRILILDDSTSAIDSETEEKIAKAMDVVMKNRTTFLITHRLSAIRDADKIVVLKDGRIHAVGRHEELLVTSNDYQRIFSKQYKLPETDRKRTSLKGLPGGAD